MVRDRRPKMTWRAEAAIPVCAGNRPFAEADGNRTRPPTLAGALVLKTRRATRPQSPPGSGYLRSGSKPQSSEPRERPFGRSSSTSKCSGSLRVSFHQLAELLGKLSHHVLELAVCDGLAQRIHH